MTLAFRVALRAAPALLALACAADDMTVAPLDATGSTGGFATGTGGGPAGNAGKGGTGGTGGKAENGGTSSTGGAAGTSTFGGSAGQPATTGPGGGPGVGGGGAAGAAGSTSFGGMGPTSGKKFCDLPGAGPTKLTVPPGFCVRSFAPPSVVPEPRTLRIAPNGDVFVGSPATSTPGGAFGGLGAIVVLPDDDHDGVADTPVIFAGGVASSGSCKEHDADPTDFTCGHGIAFIDGFLYLTRWNDVRRYPYAVGDRKAKGVPQLVATLGMEDPLDFRFTHTLDRAPNGDVLVSRGRYDSSTCTAASMGEGAVFRLPVAGGVPTTAHLVGQGFRNPMYVRCHPTSGTCFANELSGDGWDGIGGHEKLVVLSDGSNWGYPCCVDKGKPTNGGTDELCATVATETVSFPLHDTPFGLDFNRGSFPGPYKNALFVANHGHVGSPWVGTGVVWYPVDPATSMPMPLSDPNASPMIFVGGFGAGAGTVNGRATDVAFSPDGRMFVIDDTSSEVWWVAPVDLESPLGW